MEELLKVMTNSVFENTRKTMVESKLYEAQLLNAARYNSDIDGYPEEIKQANFERAVQNAFILETRDFEGNLQTINLYDYLSDANKKLLNTVAPQHRRELQKITAENNKLIQQNTAERLQNWMAEAEITAAEEGVAKSDVLKYFQENFEIEAGEFIFPEEPQYQQHDAEHHVSEVMSMPEYDTAIQTPSAEYDTENINTTAENNDLAFLNVREKMRNLQQKKVLTEYNDLSAEKTSKNNNVPAARAAIYRKPEDLSYKNENDRS